MYSIIPEGEGIFIAGETGRPGDKGFFIGKVSIKGELLWLKDFGSWENAVLTTLLPAESGLVLIGSLKGESWVVKAFEFSKEGKILREETLAHGIALTAHRWKERLALAGYRGENFWVQFGDQEIQPGEGTATSLLPVGNKLLVGGELAGKVVVAEVSEEPRVHELWDNGWVEVLDENLALGVKGGEMVIFPF